MEFSALDPVKIVALMVAGGLFSLAGLWLMFRPKTDGHSAKIELFGLKFESSSAGLLVFVIGAGFLAAPLFVPDSASSGGADMEIAGPESDSVDPHTSTEAVVSDTGQVRTAAAQPAIVTTTSPRALTVVGAEIEPNDNIAEANEIPIGSVIHGEVEADNPDFYTFAFPGNFVGRFTVNLSGDAGFSTYDDLGGRYLQGDHRKYSREVDATRYYVSVGTRERRAAYTLTVAAREE